MNTQTYARALLLSITFSCAAMDEQQPNSADELIVHVPHYRMRKNRFRKQAEAYLTKAIACEVMGHQDGGVNVSQIARVIEHYFIAQKAREDGDEKSWEQHLLQAAELKYTPSYLELAALYLKRAKECYQRARELGDVQAAAILAGLRKYSLEQLLTNKPEAGSVPTDNPPPDHMYL